MREETKNDVTLSDDECKGRKIEGTQKVQGVNGGDMLKSRPKKCTKLYVYDERSANSDSAYQRSFRIVSNFQDWVN